mmetsp:Transcript_8699/g.28678  ORF Transcript_8699/g.28678 Transcript_8699/m.28678 type:complete len:252 (+) Transcript_8699:494-1249(+)
MAVDSKLGGDGVHVRHVGADGCADAEDVRGLSHVVRTTAGPHQHVVGEVADDLVRALGGRSEGAREVGDVLVVPRVAVGDGGAVGDARDLVPVVPPRHDAGVLGGVVADPVVRLEVVIHHHGLAALEASLEHDRGLGHGLGHHVRVVPQLEGGGADDEAAAHGHDLAGQLADLGLVHKLHGAERGDDASGVALRLGRGLLGDLLGGSLDDALDVLDVLGGGGRLRLGDELSHGVLDDVCNREAAERGGDGA